MEPLLRKVLGYSFCLSPDLLSPNNIRAWRRQLDPPDLEKFVLWNDKHLYDKDIGITYMTDRAQLRLFNSSSSLHDFHSALEELDLADERRLRPGWDQYFMQLASLAAQRSNCMKRRVGCVLVRGRRVISTGYNGTPRNTKNCNEGGCEISSHLRYLWEALLNYFQALVATVGRVVVLHYPPAYASTQKKMLYWRPGVNG